MKLYLILRYLVRDNRRKGDKFELWSLANWEARQHGGPLSTEILEVVLPETVKNMSF